MASKCCSVCCAFERGVYLRHRFMTDKHYCDRCLYAINSMNYENIPSRVFSILDGEKHIEWYSDHDPN